MNILKISIALIVCVCSLCGQAKQKVYRVESQTFNFGFLQPMDTVKKSSSTSLQLLLARVYHANIFRSVEIEQFQPNKCCDFVKSRIFNSLDDQYSSMNTMNISIGDNSLYETTVEFHTGSNKLQILDVSHVQRFSKFLIGSIEYQKQGYSGNFDRQSFDRSNLELGLDYTSKSSKLKTGFGIIWFNQTREENGGITKAAIDTLIEQDPSVVSVRLLNAETKTKQVLYNLKNEINLKRTDIDSVGDVGQELNIAHQFQLELAQRKYTDENPLSGFYDDVIYDSLYTKDLAKSQIVRNLFAINYSAPSGYSVQAGILNSCNRIKLLNLDSTFSNTALKLGASHASSIFITDLQLQYYIDGNNSGDYFIVGQTELRLVNARNKLRINYSKRAFEALFFNTYYQSNHFAWYNIFNKSQETKGELYYSNTGLGLLTSVSYTHSLDYVYYGTNGTPRQFDSGIDYFNMSASKTLDFWRISTESRAQFHFYSKEAPLSLPKINLEQSFYISDTIFKNALKAKLGFQFEWASNYYGDAYMPATSLYYYQRSTETGDNLLTNIFLELGVGTATISVTVLNVLQETLGAYRIETPDYPLPGRLLIFGVNWKFKD